MASWVEAHCHFVSMLAQMAAEKSGKQAGKIFHEVYVF